MWIPWKRKRAREHAFWTGIVKVRELPHGCTEEDFVLWWPRLSERERERYTAHEARNVLTLNGFNQILTYIASGNAMTYGFSQFFSVGTFPILSVQAGDASVTGELFRAAPTTSIITGNQLTLSTVFGPSQAIGNYTNAGLFGGGSATATLGTGTLFTHTLYTYPKPSGQAISNDYIISLQ